MEGSAMTVNRAAAIIVTLAVLLGGTVLAAKPPQTSVVTPPVIVDATGKTVGPLMSYWVTMTLDGRSIKLSLDNPVQTVGEFYDYAQIVWHTAPVFYESNDCSGTGYLGFLGDASYPYQFDGVVTKGSSDGTYVLNIGDLSKVRSLTTNSMFDEGACYFQNDGYTHLVSPIVASYDLGAMFTLPLRVK
jgi:hypothetical protein